MTLLLVDMTSLYQAFAVANTPLFLLRKVKESPVTTLVQQYSSEEIFRALQDALREKPVDMSGFVAPFVYIVAIAEKGDLDLLAKAASLCAPFHNWYKEIGEAVVALARPTTVQKFAGLSSIVQAPNPIRSTVNSSSTSSTAPWR